MQLMMFAGGLLALLATLAGQVGGDIGLAETYMDGHWDTDDLVADIEQALG